MKPFNTMFMESGGKPLTIDGTTIQMSFRHVPSSNVETRLEWEFNSPHPPEDVALKVRAVRCSFRYPGVDEATEVFAIHGEANRGWVIVDRIGENPLIKVTNAYRSHLNPDSLECFTGNQAMKITEQSPGVYQFQANNCIPEDRMAFADITGTIRVTTTDTGTANYDRLPQHPDYPHDSYCFIDTEGAALNSEDLVSRAVELRGKVTPTSESVTTIIGRLDGTTAKTIASSETAVTLRINLNHETTSDFAMRDEARLWNLALVRLGDKQVLNTPE